ncbi:hypothetical protein HOY80DRAFT_1093035 [Tuber brumale]|nr:hypothetical protein HOY80DRAFT_1093035 [Tuber brumale]
MHDSVAPHGVPDPVNTAPSQNRKIEETAWGEITLVPLYLGMAATRIDGMTVNISLLIHDGFHTKDYCTNEFNLSDGENMGDLIKENTIHTIVAYSTSNSARFVGAGVTLGLEEICPGICAHLWRKLDIVCMLLKAQTTPSDTRHMEILPLILTSRRILQHVIPDAERAIRLVEDLREYKDTVHESTWNTVLKYIPEADLEAFRITKTNHNILQGVADPEALSPGGPLAPGGADVVIIDDPHMPALIPLTKKAHPEAKIIYRSRIEVSKDLVEIPGSPQRQVGQWIWGHSLILLLRPRNHLLYPTTEYITQTARFDTSKGIPNVIESYRQLCVCLRMDAPERLPPQLLICGHGAIDDPDAGIVYNETIALLRQS